MNSQAAGLIFVLLFIGLESLQTVFFGGLFQRVNSFFFGALVFGLTCTVLIAWTVLRDAGQIRAALAHPRALFLVNIGALVTFTAFLLSVQLIEPVITYTVSSAMMPITALVLARRGWTSAGGAQSGLAGASVFLLVIATSVLCAGVIFGLSGFVRGGVDVAVAGLALAMLDGVFFTLIIAGSDRLSHAGVGPAALLSLRLILYVVVTCGVAAATVTPAGIPDAMPLAGLVAIGVLLTVPPLYFLQRAIPLLGTFAISALTALGPLVIFGLQRVEGRVEFSAVTLLGLGLYALGALLAAVAAMRQPVAQAL